MEQFEVTKLGERGQIVIPQEFRKSMGLQRGEKFVVVSRSGMLILKRLKAPSIEEFEVMLRKGHSHAKKHGLTPKDLAEAIRKARARK